ncbi:MAG: class I SAM-dependent methyltransferase [Chloroflexi bacterium]|nr:MAG: class I SAM-dependent methyltransferase [Chloroflexota bacterium]
MAGDYDILAPIYDRIGLAEFATQMTPRILNFVQRNGWLGRRILDIGCGTGAVTNWFGEHSYIVIGIDQSAAMLAQARKNQKTGQTGINWIEADILTFDDPPTPVDMVMALQTFNDMESLRELEQVFQNALALLGNERWFIFDLLTIEGLAARNQNTQQVIFEDDSLLVISHDEFDYDRQVQTRYYQIFQRDGDVWLRDEAKQVLRAYPVQAVASLLRRVGFEGVNVVTTDFKPFAPGQMGQPHAIFIAKKKAE